MWHDGVLLPATNEELEWINMCEREREALWRLKEWQRLQREAMRWERAHARVGRVCATIARRCRQVVASIAHFVAHTLIESSAYGMRIGGLREQPWIQPWDQTWIQRREGD
jgi:hypothetical protein